VKERERGENKERGRREGRKRERATGLMLEHDGSGVR